MTVVIVPGVLGSIAFTAVGASAATTTLYVSPTGVSNATDASCLTAAYSTIQEAVTAAAPGDTIEVCAGSYTGPVSVGIANLTIMGTGATRPTVTVSGTSAVVFDVGSSASTTTIEDLTITGGSDGVYSNQGASNLTVRNNTFTDVNLAGAAVNVYGLSSTSPVSGVTISGNQMEGPGTAVALFNTTSAEVNANTIEDSSSGNAGLYLGGSDSAITITGNHFANDDSAIYVDNYGGTLTANTTTTVHSNYFNTTDDTTGGVGALFIASGAYTGTLDATGNWWGSPLGPTTSAGSRPGRAGALVSANVNYTPWCRNANCVAQGPEGRPQGPPAARPSA